MFFFLFPYSILILFADFLYGFGCLVKRGPLRSLEVARECPSCFAIISQKALKRLCEVSLFYIAVLQHACTTQAGSAVSGRYIA